MINEALEKYGAENVYNADETGLYFRALPTRTLCLPGEAPAGFKKEKERITVLLTANASGSRKLKPLVIGKAQRPQCFGKASILVTYKANKKVIFLKFFVCVNV